MSKSKKGVSGLIVTVLLILMVLIIILALYNIIIPMINRQLQISEAQSILLTEKVEIQEVIIGGDPANPASVNLTLKKGPGKMKIKNHTIIPIPPVYVYSVFDLSGSMDYDLDNTNPGLGSRLDHARPANINFVNTVLEKPGNKVGLVSYNSEVLEIYSHNLSEDNESLISKMNTFDASGWTCICCGINKAKDELSGSKNASKAIIVMSDGTPTRYCEDFNDYVGNGNQFTSDQNIQASIDAGQNACDQDISVFTIGFGTEADEDTLRAIACNEENYYYASTQEITEVYTQLAMEIKEYGAEELYDHLKIMFYNQTDSYEKRIPMSEIPGPLETKIILVDILPEGAITNINKIEIYPVLTIESGTQVIGPLLDKWELNSLSTLKLPFL